MTTLKSYDLNGQQLSFANWISNLSPQETPFTSMTGKESINQTLFQWQTDTLASAGLNAQKEGDVATDGTLAATHIKSNVTQILRKTVKVSDTANALANYGRGKELQYQMEKAGKEIKRDLEYCFLHQINAVTDGVHGGQPIPRKTAGFEGLVAARGLADPDTKAIVHKKTNADNTITEAELFDLTYNLYLSGSQANIIMFHPTWASFFSSLQEKSTGGRQRIFEDTPKFSVHVSTIVDPLGQEFRLIPNRWMPKDKIFFFNPSDWTQMVLRAPSRTKLAKDGSYEKWMIEMEVGLRHRNPYASGILDTNSKDDPATNNVWATAKMNAILSGGGAASDTDLKSNPANVRIAKGTNIKFKVKLQYDNSTAAQIDLPDNTKYTVTTNDRFVLVHNGKEEGHWTLDSSDISTSDSGRISTFAITQPANDRELQYTSHAEAKHNGEYRVELRSQAQGWKVIAHTAAANVVVV